MQVFPRGRIMAREDFSRLDVAEAIHERGRARDVGEQNRERRLSKQCRLFVRKAVLCVRSHRSLHRQGESRGGCLDSIFRDRNTQLQLVENRLRQLLKLVYLTGRLAWLSDCEHLCIVSICLSQFEASPSLTRRLNRRLKVCFCRLPVSPQRRCYTEYAGQEKSPATREDSTLVCRVQEHVIRLLNEFRCIDTLPNLDDSTPAVQGVEVKSSGR